jgi:uncharacterized protein YlxP (DUF503 family)
MPVVGFLLLTLYMPGNTSLKDKRRVVKSVLAKVRARFNASCSEVGSQDDREEALLGFSVCGPESRILRTVLSRILDFIEDNADAELVDYEIYCPLAPDDLDDDPMNLSGLVPKPGTPPTEPPESFNGLLAAVEGAYDDPELADYDDEEDDDLDDEGGLDDDGDGGGDDEPATPGVLKFRPGPKSRGGR